MPTCYHLHVAEVGMLQKWEVEYQHGTEPTHRLLESALADCRLPIPCSPRPGRTGEPTSAHLGLRSSNGSAFHQLPDPSTNDREPSAPSERKRHGPQSRQVRAFHPATRPVSEFPVNCRPFPKPCCHHRMESAWWACTLARFEGRGRPENTETVETFQPLETASHSHRPVCRTLRQ